MRVWLVQRAESTPHDDGGARRLMRMGVLADFLQSKGHTVVWWTSAFDHIRHEYRFKESKRLEVKTNYSIQYLKCFGYKNNKSISRLIDNKVVSSEFTKEASKDVNRPDVILVAMPSIELAQQAIHYANERNIPVFLDIRDLWPDVFRDYVPKFMSWFVDLVTIPMRKKLKQSCMNSTAITGITEEFVNWGVAHSGRLKSDSDKHFPMAYVRHQHDDMVLENAYTFWEKLGVNDSSGDIIVLFLGTFTKSFNFETIFEAAKKLEASNMTIKFIFCGVGAKEAYIGSSCSKFDNCIFAGWINAAQIHVALKLSAIGIAPYKETPNFIDNIPNKPAEYMSEGLIVATSLTKGALFELLKEKKCGFSYGEDSNILVRYLLKLTENREELVIMQEFANIAFEAQFNGDKIYEKFVSYLEYGAKKTQ